MSLLLKIVGLFGVLVSITFADEIKIAASSVPHAEILNQVKPILAKQGITLTVIEFNDYIQPNMVVAQKQFDANYFEHMPYLNEFNKRRNTNLVPLVKMHIEPMGIYVSNNKDLSLFKATKSFTKFPKRDITVGVPNDTTNEGRALLLLQQNKFIKLDQNVSFPTKNNIIANFYNIKIVELDPAMLPRMLINNQLDLAVINSNYALAVDLSPIKNAIFLENSSSKYVNVVVVRADNKNTLKIKKLAAALHDPKIKSFIIQKYKGAIVPVF